jgi:hypothetical protein
LMKYVLLLVFYLCIMCYCCFLFMCLWEIEMTRRNC